MWSATDTDAGPHLHDPVELLGCFALHQHAPCSPPHSARKRRFSHRRDNGDRGDSFALRFFEPQWAVTPGRSAVLFDGKVCLGGGVIASTSAS